MSVFLLLPVHAGVFEEGEHVDENLSSSTKLLRSLIVECRSSCSVSGMGTIIPTPNEQHRTQRRFGQL